MILHFSSLFPLLGLCSVFWDRSLTVFSKPSIEFTFKSVLSCLNVKDLPFLRCSLTVLYPSFVFLFHRYTFFSYLTEVTNDVFYL